MSPWCRRSFCIVIWNHTETDTQRQTHRDRHTETGTVPETETETETETTTHSSALEGSCTHSPLDWSAVGCRGLINGV
eukprot:1788983-Rhodomonas_salina.1